MAEKMSDPFGARATLEAGGRRLGIYRLRALQEAGLCELERLPFSIRILLESALRHLSAGEGSQKDVEALAAFKKEDVGVREVAFRPARVLMQDFTGVPAVVDLAALRSALRRLGGDPKLINPLVPVDMVIDHSVQVDRFGGPEALLENARIEFERNQERYAFLRWGSEAFANFRVVPPSTGIVHQVNLEYLARVLQIREMDGELVAFPDTLVGTDSHTTMINGLGVLGWGVGGIEAEACMLGQPISMVLPQVVGLHLVGELPEGATATDLVLTVVQTLRAARVVGKFVEFFGPGVEKLGLADRATLANMAPEYGATMGYFPVDEETLRYLRDTGRAPDLVQMVEAYFKEQELFQSPQAPHPRYSQVAELDMGSVEPSLAGPRRPQDRVPLAEAGRAFKQALQESFGISEREPPSSQVEVGGRLSHVGHGAVVIAAITSCTNTSNPSVMLAAGLLARNACERGLKVPAHVKTSLAPGSRVVTRYLLESGLLPSLEALGFNVVGYGCTTCIGNSGPLPEPVAQAILEHDLVACAVLSGNRNFEGRISPFVKANYLASPPLVVAYALAGRMDIDLQHEPLGLDDTRQPVYLRDIWPSQEEIQRAQQKALSQTLFREEYASVFDGNPAWNAVPSSQSELYPWDADSTYIREPDFFLAVTRERPSLQPLLGVRALMVLGDSVTTDHISPAGAIPPDGPAGGYLQEHGVPPSEFNSFGSRRGNHEVMMRGTFANIRIRNLLAPGTEGGWSRHIPSGQVASVFETAMRYKEDGTPLLVLAGKEYGTGSSRDWAAKGPSLLGVRMVLAESFERIHRSNLVGMGVLPLQFLAGQNRESLGLSGEELFDLPGLDDRLAPGQELELTATDSAGGTRRFSVLCRVDSRTEVDYLRQGGILHAVLRQLAGS